MPAQDFNSLVLIPYLPDKVLEYINIADTKSFVRYQDWGVVFAGWFEHTLSLEPLQPAIV
jgi:hypothetical protein